MIKVYDEVDYTNMTDIQRIKINRLFGNQNIDIVLKNGVNIFVGENGLGKTNILNCIYYLISNDFDKLSNINFKSIEIFFKDFDKDGKNSIKIQNKIYGRKNSIEEYKKQHAKKLLNSKIDEDYINSYVTFQKILDYIEMKDTGNLFVSYKNNKEKLNEISEKIKENIIYLPTYRRIEIDLKSNNVQADNLEYDDNLLIKFGMDDVKKSISNIMNRISEVAMKSFNDMNAILLTEYVNDNIALKKRIFNSDVGNIEVILNRIGKAIDKQTKNMILDLLHNGGINESKYLYLKNFLSILVEKSEEQKVLDNKINKFIEVCNKYFVNKMFIYDPIELTISLYVKCNNSCEIEFKKIDLNDLSSGEKQIVSLFSKLYLEHFENDSKSIVIIDEPELSLSLMWQQELLPDIMHSGKCALLITVTHSPFIFRNEFDKYAMDIKECIK